MKIIKAKYDYSRLGVSSFVGSCEFAIVPVPYSQGKVYALLQSFFPDRRWMTCHLPRVTCPAGLVAHPRLSLPKVGDVAFFDGRGPFRVTEVIHDEDGMLLVAGQGNNQTEISFIPAWFVQAVQLALAGEQVTVEMSTWNE